VAVFAYHSRLRQALPEPWNSLFRNGLAQPKAFNRLTVWVGLRLVERS
jgi:hypothetical protein